MSKQFKLITIIIICSFLSSCSNYNKKNKVNRRYHFIVGEVNGNFKVIHQTSCNDFNDDKTDYTYIYDSVLKKLSCYNKKIKSKDCFYDKLNRIDSVLWYDSGNIRSIIYNKSDFHESYPSYAKINGVFKYKMNYKLDTVKRLCYFYSDIDAKPVIDSFDINGRLVKHLNDFITTYYEYNEHGDMISESNVVTMKDKQVRYESLHIEYKYDDYGNWITKTIERKNKRSKEFTVVEKREIEYY